MVTHISALGRLREDDRYEFKPSLGYIVSSNLGYRVTPCLKKKKQKSKKIKL